MFYGPSLDFKPFIRCVRCKSDELEYASQDGTIGCTRCGATYPSVSGIPVMLPDSSTIEDAKGHDAPAEHYTEIPLVHFWDAEGSPIGKYVKSGEIAEGKNTLEVGAGCGTIARYLKAKNIYPKCIDIAIGSLANIKSIDLPALLASNMDLPIKDNSFDTVISYGVIHHTPDPALCMRELARVLKPGGDLVLVVHRKWSFYYYWFMLYAPLPRLFRKLFGKAGDAFIYLYFLLLFYLPFWLGLAVYHRKLAPPKLYEVWTTFNDQFLSPNNSYHTIDDARNWAKDAGLVISDTFNFVRPGGGALAVLFKKER